MDVGWMLMLRSYRERCEITFLGTNESAKCELGIFELRHHEFDVHGKAD